MFKRVLSAAIGVAAVMIMGSAPAIAQTETPAPRTANGAATPPARSVQPGRIGGGRQAPRADRRRPEQTPEQVKAAAEALIVATGSTCQTTEAVARGQVGEGQIVYEVACAGDQGLILISSTPPKAVNCIDLFGQADIARAADPAADVGLQCTIEANKDILSVMKRYAAAAGVTCNVDAGAAVGMSANNVLVYEVGCVDTDGFRLEKSAAGWSKTACFQVVSGNGQCRYTTAAEQNGTLKAWLASSAASSCDVTGSRLMGENANGSFYEAKCAAGDGVIVRFNAEMAVQQVYPCAEAARIGGGCKLTAVPAAAAAPPASR